MEGKIYISPSIASMVAQGFLDSSKANSLTGRSKLTPREQEVLQLLSEGLSTKEIAFQLKVSVKTIETFRQKISEKLGINSIAELTKYAIREGLTTLNLNGK
jgi:DNA-binding NarL/FixJ family response regulator